MNLQTFKYKPLAEKQNMNKTIIYLLLIFLIPSFVISESEIIKLSRDMNDVEILPNILGTQYRMSINTDNETTKIEVPVNIEILYKNAEPTNVEKLEQTILWIFVLDKGKIYTFENVEILEILFRYPNDPDQIDTKVYNIFS